MVKKWIKKLDNEAAPTNCTINEHQWGLRQMDIGFV